MISSSACRLPDRMIGCTRDHRGIDIARHHELVEQATAAAAAAAATWTLQELDPVRVAGGHHNRLMIMQYHSFCVTKELTTKELVTAARDQKMAHHLNL
jgi:hypothetical protein